jgi:hypothetical protein
MDASLTWTTWVPFDQNRNCSHTRLARGPLNLRGLVAGGWDGIEYESRLLRRIQTVNNDERYRPSYGTLALSSLLGVRLRSGW